MAITVKDLICELLRECGKDKRADQIFKELNSNEVADRLLLIDNPLHCREPGTSYIDGINVECGFIELKLDD